MSVNIGSRYPKCNDPIRNYNNNIQNKQLKDRAVTLTHSLPSNRHLQLNKNSHYHHYNTNK